MARTSGDFLEKRLINACEQYRIAGKAVISKVPTPFKVFTDHQRKHSHIRTGVFEKKSTVDFEGTSQGRSIAFEAKSTIEHTRFPLKNIEEHQIYYLRDTQDQGGVCFFLIEFAKTGEVFYITFDQVYEWWQGFIRDGKKSIPKKWFDMNCPKVSHSRFMQLDFLKCVFPEIFGQTS
ncbi:Holliday junction resolvase RecU [Fictibacillus sp. NRS-1165]|uniref:Holliday junction resolvase RecU n=1 Tax=Fictibacillus sp. NRS-1165 TaxID=3144463 RepID=UPI003D1CC0DF